MNAIAIAMQAMNRGREAFIEASFLGCLYSDLIHFILEYVNVNCNCIIIIIIIIQY